MGNKSNKKKKIIGTGEEFENDQIDDIPGRDRKRSVIHFNPNVIVSEVKSDPYKDYKVIKTIGEGTYGKVELVEHKVTGMVRAMKVIKKSNPNTNDVVIYNELNILKQIDHQNVVKIYEYFIDAVSIINRLKSKNEHNIIYIPQEDLEKNGLFKTIEVGNMFKSAWLIKWENNYIDDTSSLYIGVKY